MLLPCSGRHCAGPAHDRSGPLAKRAPFIPASARRVNLKIATRDG